MKAHGTNETFQHGVHERQDQTYPIRNLNDVSFVSIPVHGQEMEHGIVRDIYFMFQTFQIQLSLFFFLISPHHPLCDNKRGSLFVEPTVPSV